MITEPSDEVWKAAEEIAKAISAICVKRKLSFAEGMMAANLGIANIAGIVAGQFDDLKKPEERAQ